MRVLRTSFLAGVASVALGAAALAQTPPTHVMTVALPGGGTAQIAYTGNVAPQVSINDVQGTPAPLAAFAPLPVAQFFGPGSPFAQLDRISAEMDRQAAVMFQQARQLAAEARSGQLTETALHNLPPGSQGYTFISTMSGNDVCSQSVEITRPASGGPPHVVTHSSGDCTAAPAVGGAGAVSLPNAAPASSRPDLVWTAAHGQQPYRGLVAPIPTTPAH